MHLQIRVVPARSPASLVELLRVLADKAINLQSAGGCDIETGGEFVFAVAHGEEELAVAVLKDSGYQPHLVEVDSCTLINEPGQLLACIAAISDQNALESRAIRDITIGAPDADGLIQVQVYSDVP